MLTRPCRVSFLFDQGKIGFSSCAQWLLFFFLRFFCWLSWIGDGKREGWLDKNNRSSLFVCSVLVCSVWVLLLILFFLCVSIILVHPPCLSHHHSGTNGFNWLMMMVIDHTYTLVQLDGFHSDWLKCEMGPPYSMITDHSDSLDNIQHIFALFTRYSFHSFTLCSGVVDISHPSLFLLLSFPSSSFDEALVFLSFSLFSLTRWTRRSKKKWDKRANVKKRCARTEEARGESRAGQGRGSGIDRGSSKPMFSFVSIPSFIHTFIPSTFFFRGGQFKHNWFNFNNIHYKSTEWGHCTRAIWDHAQKQAEREKKKKKDEKKKVTVRKIMPGNGRPILISIISALVFVLTVC